MSTTAFSELPPHWQRHHFAEVPTTMELLREDALEERALIEEEKERRKENSESSKREHAQGVNIPGKESQNEHALHNKKRGVEKDNEDQSEEHLREQTPLNQEAQSKHALYKEEKKKKEDKGEIIEEKLPEQTLQNPKAQSKHALYKEEKEKKEDKGEIIEEELPKQAPQNQEAQNEHALYNKDKRVGKENEDQSEEKLPEQTPQNQESQNEHALYNKNKKAEKNRENTPDENASNKKIVLNDKCAKKIQLVTTDYQTHGHGQVNTVWESARGENLLFSFLFRPEHITAGEQFFLSEITCLAVAHTLDAYTEGISVKWPNDIYHHDRKISGMLLRHTLSGAQISTTLVGIGLNLNQKQFVGDAPNPISLRQIIGRPVDREEVLCRFAHHFDRHLRAVTPPDPDERLAQRQRLHREYLRRLYHRDGAYDYVDAASGETFSAHIVDVAPTGQLTLRTTDGRLRHYHFKEVRFVVPLPTTAPAHV